MRPPHSGRADYQNIVEYFLEQCRPSENPMIPPSPGGTPGGPSNPRINRPAFSPDAPNRTPGYPHLPDQE